MSVLDQITTGAEALLIVLVALLFFFGFVIAAMRFDDWARVKWGKPPRWMAWLNVALLLLLFVGLPTLSVYQALVHR